MCKKEIYSKLAFNNILMLNYLMLKFFKTISYMLVICVFSITSVSAKNVFFIGHSLTDFDLPYILSQLAHNAGFNHKWKFQIIIGSPLKWNWQHAKNVQNNGFSMNSRDPNRGLPSGNFDTVVLTPSGRLPDHLRWSDPHIYASKFYALALQKNSDAEAFIYQVWPSLDPKNWIEKTWEEEIKAGLLGDEKSEGMGKLGLVGMSLWMTKHLKSANPVRIVPAALAMLALKEKIDNGEVPHLKNLSELFSDDIHLNKIGNYFVACVHFSSIYNQSPIGLKNTVTDLYNRRTIYLDVPEDLAKAFQRIAWESVNEFNSNYKSFSKLEKYSLMN